MDDGLQEIKMGKLLNVIKIKIFYNTGEGYLHNTKNN